VFQVKEDHALLSVLMEHTRKLRVHTATGPQHRMKKKWKEAGKFLGFILDGHHGSSSHVIL